MWASGDSYKGSFEDGKEHGTGLFKWKNGNVYEVSTYYWEFSTTLYEHNLILNLTLHVRFSRYDYLG